MCIYYVQEICGKRMIKLTLRFQKIGKDFVKKGLRKKIHKVTLARVHLLRARDLIKNDKTYFAFCEKLIGKDVVQK